MHSLLGLPELGDLRYNTLKMLLTNGMQVIGDDEPPTNPNPRNGTPQSPHIIPS